MGRISEYENRAKIFGLQCHVEIRVTTTMLKTTYSKALALLLENMGRSQEPKSKPKFQVCYCDVLDKANDVSFSEWLVK